MSALSIRREVSEPPFAAAPIGEFEAAFVVKRIVNSCSRLRSSCIRLPCFIATDLVDVSAAVSYEVESKEKAPSVRFEHLHALHN